MCEIGNPYNSARVVGPPLSFRAIRSCFERRCCTDLYGQRPGRPAPASSASACALPDGDGTGHAPTTPSLRTGHRHDRTEQEHGQGRSQGQSGRDPRAPVSWNAAVTGL